MTPGVLDLIWRPAVGETEPPAGQAPGIYRHDTYLHVLRLWSNPPTNTVPFDLEGDFTAQLREELVVDGEDPGTPLAEFTVNIIDNEIHLLLPSTTTKGLIVAGFWDLQNTLVDDTVQTFLAGKFKVFDDVTRP